MSRSTLAAALLLLACGGERPLTRGTDVPVFIISIDTLRSDRLPAYGYRVASTPAIDSLRNDAILFQHAFSHVPLTLPSHASILTGRLPPAHRVRDNGGYTMPSDIAALPRLLRENGYATGGAVSSFVLRSETGISSGFDFFDDDLDPGDEERDGDRSRAALSRWLDGIQSRPVFGFLHLFEPHAPYEGGYDAEVQRADSIVGRFLAELKKRRLYRSALIILLSDHGEGLGDHGEDEHGVFLYRESIQVPLIVKLPENERAGEAVSRHVALVDVFPTVLEVVGLKRPEPVDGVSLLGADGPSRAIYSETFFPRLHLGWGELFSIIDDEHHYIEAPRSELYRYRSDPAERMNLLSSERRAAAAMRAHLSAADRTLTPPASISSEDRQSLVALGYLGMAAHRDGSLPDPKDRIHFLRSLKSAFAAVAAAEHARVVGIVRPLTEDAPELVDAWTLLGNSQAALGQREKAVETFRTAAARFPDRGDLRLRIAELYFERRDYAAAETEARAALESSEIAANELLAKIAFARGDKQRARQHIAAALERMPERVSALLLAAQIAASERSFTDALSLLERAEQQILRRRMAPVRELHSRKAEALLELRRVQEAQQEFQREVTLFPDQMEAWGGLAVLRAAQGDTAGARDVLREALQRNRNPRARKLARETLQAIGDAEGARLLGLE